MILPIITAQVISRSVDKSSIRQYSRSNKLRIACAPPISSFPPEALLAFVKFLEKNKELQSKIKNADSPQQIIDIAESEGFTISSLELRTWSKELTADYFPWATQGNEFRRNFFKGKGQ